MNPTSSGPAWSIPGSLPPDGKITDVGGSVGGKPLVYKAWETFAAELGSNSFHSINTETICEVLKKINRQLTSVVVTEIIILVGKLLAAGPANHEQLDSASTALVEAFDKSAVIDWEQVFTSLPKVDPALKINSLECFAFLMAIFRRKKTREYFPVHIALNQPWTSSLSQALFLKWTVISVAATSASSPYQLLPFVMYLRVIEVPPNLELLDTCPNVFLSGDRHSAALWSNTQLLSTLLDIAEKGSAAAAAAASSNVGMITESEEVEAARIVFELLKSPTMGCPNMLLGSLVKSLDISPNIGRPLAAECLDQLWKAGQQRNSNELSQYIRWLASLNPGRFATVAIGAIYTRSPERIDIVAAALKSDASLLAAVLSGPPTPFRFHVAHLSWSGSFNAALWLKERLQTDTEEVSKEFLLFLILSLCPLEVLQQMLTTASAHPMRRLQIGCRDLWLYLSVIVGTCASPEIISSLGITCEFDVLKDSEALSLKPLDTVKTDILKFKQAAARLLPQLAGFVHLIQPNNDLEDVQPTIQATPIDIPTGTPPDVSFGPEIDAEVHRHFAALYAEELSCVDMVSLMHKFASSPPNSRNYLIFNHMVTLLFHECRFFPKYPLSELAITAELMGQMIRSEVLVGHGSNGTTHLLAIRCIIEALRKGENSKMFRFAITAMEHFVGIRLAAWPDFLVALSTGLPDVRTYFPSYSEFADKCLSIMPAELKNRHYIDHPTLSSLSLPPPPVPIIHPDFSLSRHRQVPTTQLQSTNTNLTNQLPTHLPYTNNEGGTNIPQNLSVLSSSDGLPPQRPLLLHGRPISLGGFGLGTVEQLLSAEPALQITDPPQWFCDQVSQIFNSLVSTNLDQKSHDLRSILQPEWQGFLALYVVKSRASKETNFHETYIQLIETVGWPKLFDMVVCTTYDCINLLLTYCDAAKESSSYRTVLKNLGAWLGTITLARNRPLKSKAIDLKNLLFDGYENGRLRALAPLCCKILEGVGHSKNFRPPNPWSVAIFSLLAEIHSVPNLITPLVFEIEVLFKNLGLPIQEFKGRTNHLSKRNPPIARSPDFAKRSITDVHHPDNTTKQGIESIDTGGIHQHFQHHRNALATTALSGTSMLSNQTHTDSQLKDQTIVTPHIPHSNTTTTNNVSDHRTVSSVASALASDSALVRAFAPASITPSESTIPTPSSAPSSGNRPDMQPSLLAGLIKSVIISPSLVLFQLKPALKAVIPHAIECAIKEIVQVVADRSVTISCVTAREVVLKDFSAEANESLIRRASHLLVASLAGSLALVTCREPLRAALCQHLRSFLLSASDKLGEDQRLVDQVVAVTTADNIELGCALVEEAVVQRALHDIEEAILPALLARRQAKALGHRQFCDPIYFNSRWASILPPALQPKPTLTGDQLQVYKDFLLFGPLHRMQQVGDVRLNNGNVPGNRNLDSKTQLSYPNPAVSETNTNTVPLLPKNDNSADTHLQPSTESNTIQPTGNFVELQTILMKVEECLSHIKDVVHEIAFCSPILGLKILPSTKFCTPLGCTLEVLDVPSCVNICLSTLSRLPSDHDVFSAVVSAPTICSLCRDQVQEMAYLSVCQRILKMINDVGVLYRDHPALIRGSDVAGLYLEVFLGLLHYVVSSESFPKSQFDVYLTAWLPNILEERRFGADVIIGLLRYELISYAKLDQLLVELSVSCIEKREIGVFDNLIKILYRIVTETAIEVLDIKTSLQELKGSCDLLARLPVDSVEIEIIGPVNNTTSCISTPSTTNVNTIGALLGRTVISLDHLSPSLFGEARRIVLEKINEVTKLNELQGCTDLNENDANQTTHIKPSKRIVTLTQLLHNYATLGGYEVRIRPLPAPFEDSVERKELAHMLFDQWMHCSLVVGSERRSKVWAAYFQSLSKQRLLQMDEETDRFFTGCVDKAIELSLAPALQDDSTEQPISSELNSDIIPMEHLPETDTGFPNLKPLDAFAKMIVAMMRLIDPSQISPLFILQRTLSVIVRCVHRDASISTTSLQSNIYYRILLSLLWEVNQPNRGLDQHTMSCLLCFSNTLQLLNPCECPAFAFCWLELISHRIFLSKMLNHVRAWPHYQRLICRLFRFLAPFHQKIHLTPGILILYKGTLRLLLVLLHDFPEFLCENHLLLCENLPFNSVQLRNLILSAFPRHIKLPDPFMPNLKVDLLPETRRAPRLSGHSSIILVTSGIKKHLDQFWKTRNTDYLERILPELRLHDDKLIADIGINYDVSRINALLLHLATQFPTERALFNVSSTPDATASAVKVALFLTQKLDKEGRYVVIGCISNHLRYPNMHTHYFSCLLLWLFGASSKREEIQEQITRVLLERLIAHRPHPWGLLITFIELIKNPRFNFWNSSFVHAVPEVQKLFQSVAQTCLTQPNVLQTVKNSTA